MMQRPFRVRRSSRQASPEYRKKPETSLGASSYTNEVHAPCPGAQKVAEMKN